MKNTINSSFTNSSEDSNTFILLESSTETLNLEISLLIPIVI